MPARIRILHTSVHRMCRVGIGTTDVFNSWIMKMSGESARVGKDRDSREATSRPAKDFILKILSLDYVRSGKALAKVMEYAGGAVEELSVDERATMTNMAAEIGGFTGIVAPDSKVVGFLVERRGMKPADAEKMIEGLQSDRDAVYAQVIELDASEITPMVATPGDPGNGKYIRYLHTPVPIEIAYGGTCTAGKNEDMDMYAAVLADALKQGKRVASSVEFWIQFGSQGTREYSKRKGYIEILNRPVHESLSPVVGHASMRGPAFQVVRTRWSSVRRTGTFRGAAGRDRCIWQAHSLWPRVPWRVTSSSTSRARLES